VEQLTNLHRDETSWRAASKLDAKHGATVGRKSTKATFIAWQTVELSILKPVSHWLFGLLFVVELIKRIFIHPMLHFALAWIVFLLAVFALVLMYYQPKGPQPTIYGNLRILVEFMNGWGDAGSGKLFLGDKGEDLEGAIQ
jgi:hypothetical protein